MILKFEIPDIDMVGVLEPGDTLATLTGMTVDDMEIEGIGAVEVEKVMCVRTP